MGFTIDSATGGLTPIPDADFAVNTLIYDIGAAEDPSGKFIFGIGRFMEDWGVEASNVNPTTGRLPSQIYGDGLDFTFLAVHPSGKFLYTADDQSNYMQTPSTVRRAT